MLTLLVVFRSRSETLDFASMLKKTGITSNVINTPKEANVGCGLSAKISAKDVNIARVIIKNKSYKAFVGIFKMYSNDGKAVLSAY